MIYKIYTDGSCKANGKKNAVGGWAFAIYDSSHNLINFDSGAEKGTTNNRMEITGMLEGLKYVYSNFEIGLFDTVEVITDSQYIHKCYAQEWYVNWMRNNWRKSDKKPVLNKELWENLIPYFKKDSFEMKWVKGHDINEYNNYVDMLAQSAAERYKEDMNG